MMFWAVLQLAAPTVAASADAVATAASAGAHAHIEARTSSNCVRVHDTECVFCQFLSMGATKAASPIPEVPVVAQVARAADELAAPHRATLRGVAIPRAPPAV
jgi:hypothetical protein